jgi:transposase InsO family protein
MFATIPQLQGLHGIPSSYAAAKKYLEDRGCNRRARVKGKGVEYLVAVPDLPTRPTPTRDYYSIDTLFAKLQGKQGIPKTVSGLRRKIIKEGWASRKREGKGGGYEYLAPCDLFETRKLELVPDLEVPQHVPTTDRKAYRLRIIESCSQWCDENGIKIGHREGGRYWSAIGRFCTAYNKQYKAKLHPHTVSRWWKLGKHQMRSDDLAGKQGQHLKGRTLIDSQPDVYKVCLAMVLDRPSHTLQQLEWQFGNNPHITVPSYQSIVRWRDRWISQNRPGYVYAKEGKTAFGSKIKPAIGIHDRDMDYPNQKWEMDGTKINALTKGGKRYTIMVFIDCFSRRVVTQIVETSSGHSAAIGLHRAMMKLGRPEIISTDNGSEFNNAQIKAALAAIGVTMHFCNPGQPQEKPLVERVHGTIATQLFERLPGSIGHNVAERKRLEETSLNSDQEWLSLEELEQHLAAWEAYYNSHRHSTIGMSPNQKSATSTKPISKFSQADSDALMERMTRKTESRKVQKKGIKCQNQWWYDLNGAVSSLIDLSVQISLNPEKTEMRVWHDGELKAIARPDKSYTVSQRHLAKANANKAVNTSKTRTFKNIKKAKAEVEMLDYIDVMPIDNVIPISTNRSIEPEILAESYHAISVVEADAVQIAEYEQQRATLAAAQQEPHEDRYDRIIATGDRANDIDRAWAAHFITTAKGREHLDLLADRKPLYLVL